MRRYYTLWLYVVLLISIASGGIQSYLEVHSNLKEAQNRTSALAASLEESVLVSYHAKRFDRIAKTMKRLQEQQRLLGAALCVYNPVTRQLTAESQGFPASFDFMSLCLDPSTQSLGTLPLQTQAPDRSRIVRVDDRRTQYLAHRLDANTDGVASLNEPSIVLVLARDLTDIESDWINTFVRTFAITLVLGLGLLLFVTLQMRQWITGNLRIFHRTLRSIIAGKRPTHLRELKAQPEISELRPITEDMDQLAKILSLRPRFNKQDKAALPPSLTQTISQKTLIVIANREPYIHQRKGDQIEVIRPASGLVTALEPILRQCGGLWIAHGSGSADMEVTNAAGEVAVPPENPTYTLKRVTLTKEEEEGYYYGFSNEGLWPLCHLAHTRPVFRLSDWQNYVRVNQKFADSIPEIALQPDSLFLLQDYHFALLPQLLKKRAGGKGPKISIFWHIPWPNPEAFGICPWNKELLEGMLGADVIGFHTQYHCNNFLEACNRYLEARIDYEHFSVTMGNHETLIRAFPIGIDTAPVRTLSDSEVQQLKTKYGIQAQYVAVGVDRIDYTKGILERCEAVEKFLERYPEYVGKFSLVQMGSPSRTHIPAYRMLYEQINETVERINARYSSGSDENKYQPIIFLPTHHEWKDIQYFYQMGDICMVTSLHDGMNLVAKEYVWCQKPERGSLILSKFTGASRELTESFIINPYSVEEIAEAIAGALRLSPAEKARRMSSMREKVNTRNAYKWASELIEALIKKEDEQTIEIRPQRQIGWPRRQRNQSRSSRQMSGIKFK
jgi:trehalose 6-phosphate synthase